MASFPSIAYNIPDFEGEAILRLFANSTQSEIGCYSAVVTNGNTFSQPASVGSILGIFTAVAMLASFATAVYGEAVPTMRLHYAHSLSVGVVFAVFQHIFYTGALSMNWPSVLVAWWSNFAWAGGMIYSSSMQNSINHLIGNNVGNTSQVGAAAAGSTQESLGGGYDLSQIYKRAFTSGMKRAANHPLMRDIAAEIYQGVNTGIRRRDVLQRSVERRIGARDLANSSTGYHWYGNPVPNGLPLPGNYSGFAGTLAEEGIRASNAFMTGFLWLLILIVLLVAAVMAFKWFLEGLTRFKTIKQERLKFFRDHWLGYSAAVALRTCYLSFFVIMFLTMFEFTYQSSGGVKGVAAIVFIIFLFGIVGVAIYACYYKSKIDVNNRNPRRYRAERKKLLGIVPWLSFKKLESPVHETGNEMQPPESKGSSVPFWKRRQSTASVTGSITRQDGEYHSIHDDEDYTMKFGWLAGRFRRTRWWFFTVWIFYEFVRAIFYAGCSGYPLAQVFGLLVIEFVAFMFIIWAKPFEGRRLNVLVVYCLGFSKVATVALSAAFDVQFNLPRIITTVIGVIIIVIQGILVILTLIAIVVGAISSYMSVSRNREDFRPRKWAPLREKYFNHLDRAVNDLPPEPKPKKLPPPEPEEPKEPHFEMKGVRRLAKIEDEDPAFASEMRTQDPAASFLSLEDRSQTPIGAGFATPPERPRSGAATPVRASRAPSLNSTSQVNLPFGARAHRPSWSTKDFSPNDREGTEQRAFMPVDMSRDVPDDEPIAQPPPAAKGAHKKTPSRSATLPALLRPHSSTEALKLGGDVSTRDTIGKVPAPTVRPRAGTYGSMRGSGAETPIFDRQTPEPGLLRDEWTDAQPGGSQSQRGSQLRHLLTPAQEQEEFGFTSKPSHAE